MIQVQAPASTANIAVGFDLLGLALKLYNTVSIQEQEQKTVINLSGEGSKIISCAKENNLVYKSIEKVFTSLGTTIGKNYKINIQNEIPVMGGLGSSSSAIVCGLLIGNALNNNRLSKSDIFNLATELDGHPDNVAPALFGGFTFSYEAKKGLFKSIDLSFPPSLSFIAITPDFRVETDKAREAMPKEYPLSVLVRSNQKLVRFIKALEKEDYSNMQAILDDEIHEPYRLKLVPGLKKAKNKAYSFGAIAAFISGSGPTLGIFAKENKENIAKEIRKVFEDEGLRSTVRFLDIDYNGAAITKEL